MFNVLKHQTILSRESLAREVAERSLAATLNQLNTNLDSMTAAEVRGYIRAHALPVVREEAKQLVGREWPADVFSELVSTALERVTHLAVQQLRMHPVVSMPSAHVQARRAA